MVRLMGARYGLGPRAPQLLRTFAASFTQYWQLSVALQITTPFSHFLEDYYIYVVICAILYFLA